MEQKKLEFMPISSYKKGILRDMLIDAYSFNSSYKCSCLKDWQDFDNFFFGNLSIADKYGFITTINNIPIGFISWDPRHLPSYAEIGFNCIKTKYKNLGYGKAQLAEAVRRIKVCSPHQIIVYTDEILLAAQKMYEAIGFIQTERTHRPTSFNKDKIKYEINYN